MAIVTGQEGLASCSVTGAAILANGTTVYTIAGGPIRITDLVSYCIVGGDVAASTIQWSCDGTVGAATTITAASASLTNAIAGTIVVCNFTTINTAPVVATAGVAIAGMTAATGGGIYAPAGIMTLVIGGADTTTGTWKHYMRWLPMRPGVSVAASF